VALPSGKPDDRKINLLMKDYVEARGLIQAVNLAARILHACLADPADEELPKSKAGEDRKNHPFPAENTGSPLSMVGDQSSDTPPPKSMN
jgi:hypothetical protein